MKEKDITSGIMNSRPETRNRIEVLHPHRSIGFLGRLVRLIRQPGRIPAVIKRRLLGTPDLIDWNSRVDKLGAYSVIDTRHSAEEYVYVTKRQKEILYPLFMLQLKGTENTVLDFGCGPGRFTGDLAGMISGKAIGVDVTDKLIKLAPSHPDVKYIHSNNYFEEYNYKFDIIWISLVLGGISDVELERKSHEISNALNPDGLLFLVESTGDTSAEDVWRVRTRAQLISLFPDVELQSVGNYFDVDQEITIFAGRKRMQQIN